MRETTALGAAIAAGLAAGVWRNFADLRDINRAGGTVFEPQILPQESAAKCREWEKAVRMSRGWVGSDAAEDFATNNESHLTRTNTVTHPIMPVDSGLSATSNVVKSLIAADTAKRTTQISVREIDVHPISKPLIDLDDLDDMDEEELFLELRRVEILRRLKKLRKPDDY